MPRGIYQRRPRKPKPEITHISEPKTISEEAPQEITNEPPFYAFTIEYDASSRMNLHRAVMYTIRGSQIVDKTYMSAEDSKNNAINKVNSCLRQLYCQDRMPEPFAVSTFQPSVRS